MIGYEVPTQKELQINIYKYYFCGLFIFIGLKKII